MALADFHYTTGISSGFKVYILEGHPSFENEQQFHHRLPTPRLPTCSIKRKMSLDVRRNPEGQKSSKARRLACAPIAVSLAQTMTPAALQIPVAPIAVSYISPSRAVPCQDPHGVHPSCPQKCPLRKPLLDSTLTVAQLQQMRPSVITCAPRQSCPKAVPSTSPQLSPAKQKSIVNPASPPSQKLCLSASFDEAASPQQKTKEAARNL